MNQATLIGHLGADAELRQTQSGESVANFSMATSERWTDKQGEKQEKTTWHRCVLWGKQADALTPWLKKGKQCAVTGAIEHRKWTDKDGAEKWTTEIRCFRLELLGSAQAGEGQQQRAAAQPAAGRQPFDEPF